MIRKIVDKIYSIVPAGVPSALVAGTILYLTLASAPLGDDTPELFEGADKVVHAIMFGAMAVAAGLDLTKIRGTLSWTWLVILAVATTAMGACIEWLQNIMGQGRSGDVADLIADAAGTVVGVICVAFINRDPRRSKE